MKSRIKSVNTNINGVNARQEHEDYIRVAGRRNSVFCNIFVMLYFQSLSQKSEGV